MATAHPKLLSGQSPIALKTLPWDLIRDELKVLAPTHFTMIDFLLSDLEDRAAALSEREQVHELMIVILTALKPGFPRNEENTQRLL